MKKFLLTIVAVALMSSAMAQSSGTTTKSGIKKTWGMGMAWLFNEHDFQFNCDIHLLDFIYGTGDYDHIKTDYFAISVVYPNMFLLGDYFFVKPTIGAGIFHSKVKFGEETSKDNKFNLLICPRVGIAIPPRKAGGDTFTIFVQYRYDAVDFKFDGEGLFGVGFGCTF